MKPARFDFHAPTDIAGTLDIMNGAAGTKPVAGNQSLGPMMNLRLVRAEMLLDVSRIEQLRRVNETDKGVRIGAAVTHAEIEDGDVLDPTPGWMRAAAANIAYRAVRNRGAIGGSVAHADPAADWVIVTTGLCAHAVVVGPEGERRVAMEEFVTGPFTTALGENELLLAIDVPKPGTGAKWGYWKYCRQVGEFAKASAAVLDDPANGRVRCVVGALGRPPVVLCDPEKLIDGSLRPEDALGRALPDRDPADFALHVTALNRALAEAKA